MNMLRVARNLMIVFVLALAAINPARAGLAGDAVRITYFYPDLDTPTTDFGTSVISGAGTDFVDPRGAFTLRVTDTQIIATDFNFSAFWLPAAFNGLVVANLSDSFTPVFSVAPATNMAGFGADNVVISGNTLRINWQGLSFDQGTRVVVNLGVVPEPHAWAMMVGGLALLGLAARRRRPG